MKKTPSLLITLLMIVGTLHLRAQIIESHGFSNINNSIPDGNAAGLSDVRTLSSAIINVLSVRVKLRISGEFNGDLYGYVRHISGGVTNFCVLLNRVGRTAANPVGYADSGLNVILDDLAGSGDIHTYRTVTNLPAGTRLTGIWKPDGRRVDPDVVLDSTPRTAILNSFIGSDANGTWTLYLADLESGGTNMLMEWGLEFTGIATPIVTWPTPADIIYGTALSSAQLNATATFAGTNVPGAFAYAPISGTVLDSGTGRTLTVVFTPSDISTFKTVTNYVAINVSKAPLTITANNASRTYGDSNPNFTGIITGIQNSDSITAGYDTVATATGAVGDYAITPTTIGQRQTNYIVSTTNGTLTVTAAPLTVTANNASRRYGALNPSFTGTITGIKNNEAITASYGTPATTESPVGNYSILPALFGATLANYNQTINPGTLMITAAPISITAHNTNRIYGAPNPIFTGAIVGILNNDNITASYTSSATTNSPVGGYAIVPAVAGDAATNYTVALTNGVLTVKVASSAGLVSASNNPVPTGQAVTITMIVSPVSPSTAVPTGTVQFRIDGANAGPPVPLSDGTASYQSSALSHGSHSVVAEYAGDGNFAGSTNSLTPNLLINTLPVAGPETIEQDPTNGVKVSIATLLSNDSDADGDLITFLGVSATSAQGGAVVTNSNWIFYTPPAGFTNADTFTYTISDGYGTPVTGVVTVNVRVDNGPPNLTITDPGNGSHEIRGDGIPGRTYRIQFVEQLGTTNWQTLGTATGDTSGMFRILDSMVSTQRFYRSVCP